MSSVPASARHSASTSLCTSCNVTHWSLAESGHDAALPVPAPAGGEPPRQRCTLCLYPRWSPSKQMQPRCRCRQGASRVTISLLAEWPIAAMGPNGVGVHWSGGRRRLPSHMRPAIICGCRQSRRDLADSHEHCMGGHWPMLRGHWRPYLAAQQLPHASS